MGKWKLLIAEKLLAWLLEVVENQRHKTGKSNENVV